MHEWLRESVGRVSLLLGAGASAPAAPLARELAKLVIEQLDEQMADDALGARLWRDVSPTLTSIYENGGDIEALQDSLRTLAEQDEDPTRHWITGFRPLGGYDETPDGRRRFKQAADWILHRLASATFGIIDQRCKDADLSHFKPMLDYRPQAIITLNYDMLVERASAMFGVPVSTGADDWDGGLNWSFSANSIPLLKLHGSFGWRNGRVREPVNDVPLRRLYEVDGLNTPSPINQINSDQIFGAGNKLRADGPWPALFRKLGDLLDNAEVLVVVGYSFRDAHVNESLLRWMGSDSRRRILNVDPVPRLETNTDSFYGYLRYHLDGEYVGDPEGVRQGLGLGRLHQLVAPTTEALPHIFDI
ncbi:hypothetical protein GCM10027421_28310 [Microbacterium shaanxiense]